MTRNKTAGRVLVVAMSLLLGGALTYLVLKKQKNINAPPEAGPEVLGALPDFALIDQTGAEYGLDQLLGKVWVGTFIFTNCRETCPIQTQNMAMLQEQLSRSSHWDRIHLVSFSVDPARDTPTGAERICQAEQRRSRALAFLDGTSARYSIAQRRGLPLRWIGHGAGHAGPQFPVRSRRRMGPDSWILRWKSGRNA